MKERSPDILSDAVWTPTIAAWSALPARAQGPRTVVGRGWNVEKKWTKREGHVCTNARGLWSRLAADVHSGVLRGARTFSHPVLLAATAGLTTVACGGSATTSVSAPSPTAIRCQPTLDASPRSFGPQGGTSAISVSVARECQWSVSSGAVWVAVTSGAQGQGDGTVNVRIDPNPDPGGAQRRAGHCRDARRSGSARRGVPFRGHRAEYDAQRPTAALRNSRSAHTRCAIGRPHRKCRGLLWLLPPAVAPRPSISRLKEYRHEPFRRRRRGRSAHVGDAGCGTSASPGACSARASGSGPTRSARAATAADTAPPTPPLRRRRQFHRLHRHLRRAATWS